MLKESGAVREAVGYPRCRPLPPFSAILIRELFLSSRLPAVAPGFWPPKQNNAGSETQNFYINTRQPCSRWESQHGLHSRSEWSRENFGQWWEQERRQLLLTRGIRNVYFVGISSQQHQKHEHKEFIRRMNTVPMSHCFPGHRSAFSLRLILVSEVHLFSVPLLIIRELFKMLQLETCFPVHQGFHASLGPQKCRKLKHRVWENVS